MMHGQKNIKLLTTM